LPVINADETPVQVQGRTRTTTRTGYLGTYISPGDHGYMFSDYHNTRYRDRPAELVEDLQAFLPTDVYGSYESLVLKSVGPIIPVGCRVHARREFLDAWLN
jgi:Transposase IS66 family